MFTKHASCGMYHSISYNSVTKVRLGSKVSELSGSSCFKVSNDQLVRKERKSPAHNLAVWRNSGIIPQNPLLNFEPDYPAQPYVPATTAPSNARCAQCETEPLQREYSLNKSKIRKKISAFFSLSASREFCAFYTITFPMNTTDDIAYKLLNTWLTRCRQNLNLASYLWIAERQKNNTIHFHMITNTRMDIRTANDYMKEAIRTQANKGNISVNQSIIDRYNGIDVDNLYKSKRHSNKISSINKKAAQVKLQKYLTKYISKNETFSTRLPWHCSRDISALFTSQLYDIDEYNKILEHIENHPDMYKVIEHEQVVIYVPTFTVNLSEYTELNKYNDMIFIQFNSS